MRIRTIVPAAVLALVAAAVQTQTEAQPAQTPLSACAKAPALHGFTVVRVADAVKSGDRVDLTLEHGSNHGLADGQSAYLVTCSGETPWRARGAHKLHGVGASSAHAATIAALLPELKGAYMAIDTGYASKPPRLEGYPANASVAEIGTLSIEGGKVVVGYMHGLRDGVLPGDAGYVVWTSTGHKVKGGDFVVGEVSNSMAFATLGISKEDAESNRAAIVLKSGKSCSVSTAEPDWGAANVAQNRPPPGYAFANVTSCTPDGNGGHRVTLDKGVSGGILPDSHIVPIAGGIPLPLKAHVTRVGKDAAHAEVKAAAGDMCNAIRRVVFAVGSCK